MQQLTVDHVEKKMEIFQKNTDIPSENTHRDRTLHKHLLLFFSLSVVIIGLTENKQWAAATGKDNRDMNELEIGFRTAMVGGFQRDDVLKYIEEMAQSHAKEIDTLKEQLKQAEADRDARGKEARSAETENKRLRGQLEEQTAALVQACAERDEKKQALEQAESQTVIQNDECSDLQQQRDALQVQVDELRRQNDSLSEKVREYDEARDSLAEIELCARKRARKLEQDTTEQADGIRAAAEQAAAEIHAAADRYAEETRTAAEQYAEETRTAADAYAASTRADAEQDASSVRREADDYAAAVNEEAEEAARVLREQTAAACACQKAEAQQAVDAMVQQMERMMGDCRGAMEILARYKTRAAEPASEEAADASQEPHDHKVMDILSSLRGKNGRA